MDVHGRGEDLLPSAGYNTNYTALKKYSHLVLKYK